MESHLSGTDSALLENFQFKLPSNASYVTDRKQSTFYASGSNEYSPTGARVVKISINESSAWLDPQSVLFSSVLQATGASGTRLYPCSSAYGFFRRLRALAGNGSVLEDITDYNRVHHLFEIQKHKNNEV